MQPLDGALLRQLRAQLSQTAIMIGRNELVETDRRLLPSVADLDSAAIGMRDRQVLRRIDQLQAVDYAYELFRRFPDDYNAFIAVLRSVGLPGPDIDIPWTEPETAGVGAAIQYREDDTCHESWTIIEDRRPKAEPQ